MWYIDFFYGTKGVVYKLIKNMPLKDKSLMLVLGILKFELGVV